MALLIPILLHGAYDFIASMENEYMGVLFLIFVSLMFRYALKLVRKVSAEDSPLMPPYSTGRPQTAEMYIAEPEAVDMANREARFEDTEHNNLYD